MNVNNEQFLREHAAKQAKRVDARLSELRINEANFTLRFAKWVLVGWATVVGIALFGILALTVAILLSGCSYKTPRGTVTFTPDVTTATLPLEFLPLEPLPVAVTRTVEK